MSSALRYKQAEIKKTQGQKTEAQSCTEGGYAATNIQNSGGKDWVFTISQIMTNFQGFEVSSTVC